MNTMDSASQVTVSGRWTVLSSDLRAKGVDRLQPGQRLAVREGPHGLPAEQLRERVRQSVLLGVLDLGDGPDNGGHVLLRNGDAGDERRHERSPPWLRGCADALGQQLVSRPARCRRPQAARWAVRCHRYGRRTVHGLPNSGSGMPSIYQLPAVPINIEDQ
ncbi:MULTISPECIES: hypothetical protein [unclassified Streptomyces]|uniref:hypothetical protein n=1 Tax=unclassified Streptomyces TaxID=2593676 RepID=UPI002E309F69|nr:MULTISPECIES: hypothetical protein [unclassified Streptomyces]WUC68349.1 hypothetical protein OG861_31165 [Streptomyces sp. NBC_00539]